MQNESPLREKKATAGPLKEAVEALEKDYILQAIEAHNGVIARAARALGLTERILAYKIKKYHISLKKRDL